MLRTSLFSIDAAVGWEEVYVASVECEYYLTLPR